MKKLLSVLAAVAMMVTMVSSLAFSAAAEDWSLNPITPVTASDTGTGTYLGTVNAGETATIVCSGATEGYLKWDGNAYMSYIGYNPDGDVAMENKEYGFWNYEEEQKWFAATGGEGSCTVILNVYYGSVTVTYTGDALTISKQSGGEKLDYLAYSNYYPSNTLNLAVGETAAYELVDAQPGYFWCYAGKNDVISFESDDTSVAVVGSDGIITAVGEGTTTVRVAYWFGPSEENSTVFADELTVVVGNGGSQPVQSQPVNTQPVYTQPVYTEPVYTEPVYTQPVTPSSVLYGDANADSVVNMKDVLTMRKYVASLPVQIDLVAGDTNGDNVVNMKDVLTVRKYIAGLIPYIDGGNTQPTQPVYTQPVYTQPVYTNPTQPVNTMPDEPVYTEPNDPTGGSTTKPNTEPTTKPTSDPALPTAPVLPDEDADPTLSIAPKEFVRPESPFDLTAGKPADGDTTLNDGTKMSVGSGDNGAWWETLYYPSGEKKASLHVKGDGSWYEYLYDENGNDLLWRSYEADGTWSAWQECYYENGNQIYKATYYADGKLKSEVLKNAAGDILITKGYDENGTVTTWWEHVYNANGVCTHEIFRTPSGKLGHEYYFNDNGKQICYRSTDKETGAITSWIVYTRDEKDYVVKEAYYDENGYLKHWYAYENDKDGNAIIYRHYDAYGIITGYREYIYDYSEYGNCVKAIDYIDGEFYCQHAYTFDANGHKIRDDYTDQDGFTYTCMTYEYDSAGNLVKTRYYNRNGELVSES